MSHSSTVKGLFYKKLDLHIHTPGSDCFLGNCTPQDIVQAALDAGLDGIAITDHNSATWINRVKEEAAKTSLVVFPGVEISCTGGRKNIHIIALFDPKADEQDVLAVLNLVGIKPAYYGKKEAVTDKGPVEVIQIINSNDGLAILAHVNSSSGVLSDMTGQPRINVIHCDNLLAAEATDFDDENKRKNHKRAIDLLDGTDPVYQRRLAVYQASDNPDPSNSGHHSLAGIGSRCSYFKMENIDLAALRQCFVDPDVRIKQENELAKSSFPQIRKVSINSGFLEGQTITFHSGLTSILGAKGTGKSLIVEFMRFALNQEPENASIRKDHISKLRTRLGEFGAVEVIVADENGKDSEITRTFREIDDSPYDDSIPYDPSQIFPVLFLSQNEIIAIAENESEQLQFIDRFFDFHTYRSRISSIEKELERLDKSMAESLRAYSEHKEIEAKIKTLDQEITSIDEALKNPIFEKYQQLEKKDKTLLAQQDHFEYFSNSINKTRDFIASMALPKIPDPLQSDPAIQRNIALIKQVHETVAESLATINRNVEKAQSTINQEYRAWHPTYDTGKKEYEQYIQSTGGDYKALAISREKLKRQREQLSKQLEAAAEKKNQIQPISKKRNDLLDNLQKEYEAYTEERKAKCDRFMENSGGKLKLSILDQSNVSKFRESLLSLKRGSYLKDEEIATITEKISPREFVMSLLRYDATKESKHLQNTTDLSGIDLRRMKTLADFLLGVIPYEELLALQYKAYPQDRPEILYDIGGENFESISNISVGQKCTAMLLMAFSDGIMPIVIDQPEDSLDIRSIWEDVCTKVRRGKETRQFVFTTHNSSVAVASDTDCYLILEGDASHGRIVYLGAMDHSPVGSEVLKYLEGGPETYHLKFEKYADHRLSAQNKKK